MMKLRVLFLTLGVLLISEFNAQEINISAGYQYSYSEIWDKAIQRYNFARPFQDKTQPLLIHGGFIEGSYFIKSKENFNSGVKLSYSLTRSSSSNLDDVSINLHQFNLGYSLRYAFEGSLKRMMVEADVSALTSILSKRVNNEIELIDEEKNRAFGVGFNLGFTISYIIEKGDKQLTPFMSIKYSPYLRSPESESILDQSISIFGTNDIRIFNCMLGLRYTLKSN